VLAAACVVGAAGCSIGDGVKFSQYDAWIPTLRVSIPEKQYGTPETYREPGKDAPAPRPPRQRAELGGTVAFAKLPTPYTGDVRLFQLDAALRAGAFGTEKVDLDLLYGLAYNNMNLDIDAGPQVGSQSPDRFGPLAGLELTWHAVPRLNIYGRATYMWGIPDTGSGQAEAGVQVQIAQELFGLVGWRHWRYRRDNLDNDFAGLDADMKINGVVFGIQLSF